VRAVLGPAGAAGVRGRVVNSPVLDLERDASRSPIALDLRETSASDLDAARTNWRERMVSEHASARVFAALVGQMMRANLPAAETRRVASMAEQELDHGLLCARVLRALGGEARAPLPRLDEVPAHADASPLEAVLRNVISIGCCSETVAVALVGTERELAGPPAVRGVLDRILADEVKHARFGWRIVAKVAPSLSAEERERIDAYLVDVFAHQVAFHAPFLDMPCAEAGGLAIGAPNGRSNWLVFLRTMEEIVVPGLAHHGFAAAAAWSRVSELPREAEGTAARHVLGREHGALQPA
jgi:hypothetical protein